MVLAAPVALEDFYASPVNTPISVAAVEGILANDQDADGDTLTALLVAGPSQGQLNLTSDGGFTYTPNSGFLGSDSFSYVAVDGAESSAVTTVTLAIGNSNEAPVANVDSYAVSMNETLTIGVDDGVLANDTDGDGDSLTADLISGPTHGTLAWNSNGSFVYTPITDFFGEDSFVYAASDGVNSSELMAVTIFVVGPNQAPAAVDDEYSVPAGDALVVAADGVLANDTDAEGDPLVTIRVSGPSYGVLTLANDGGFTYTPNAGYVGLDSFTYAASDGADASNVATVRITVEGPNTAPVANNDSYATTPGQALVTAAPGVLANDTDANNQPLVAVVVTGPAHGLLTLLPTGGFTYTPDAGFEGTDSFTYAASDDIDVSNEATVTLTVARANVAPVAANNSYETTVDQTLVVAAATGVLANDTDGDGDALTAILVAGPTHGTLALASDGSFSYTPAAGYSGADSFTYRANDSRASSNLATVNLTVSVPNRAPVGVEDAYAGQMNGPLLVVAQSGVLANDTDADNDTLTAQLVSDPAHGEVVLLETGAFSYIPTTGFEGEDSFTYTASDGELTSSVTTVRILVRGPNVAPTATSDSYVTEAGTPIVIAAAAGVLANDTDEDGDTLTAQLVTSPTHGQITFGPDGGFTYTPDAGFVGQDSFTYAASDGVASSAAVDVLLVVTAANRIPVANGDSYSVPRNTGLTIAAATGVLNNDTDPDGDSLLALIAVRPAHGTVTLETDGSFTYVPLTDFSGQDSFTYVATDGLTTSSPATVVISVTTSNTAPVAVNDSYSTTRNQPLTIAALQGVLANDSDPDSNALTATVVSGTTHGSLTLNADGSFTYIPTANYTGSDSFTYQASDGVETSQLATVSFTVSFANAAPAGTADSYSTAKNTTLVVAAANGVLANDTDADGDSLTVTLATNPVHGLVTLSANGGFTYIPTTGYSGSDSFTYTVSDGTTTSAATTVQINVIDSNVAPVAVADGYATNRNTALTVAAATGVLANDIDANSDPLTATLVAGPAHGTLTLNSNGSFTYTPTTDYVGADSFTYRASDGTATSAITTVSLNVNATNAAPVATADSYTASRNTALSVPAAAGVLANDTDANSDALTAALVAGPAHGTLTLNSNGSFTYTPTTGYVGADSFTYQASDGTATSAVTTVSLTVNSTNSAPAAVADSYSTNRNTALTVPVATGVLANDTDANSDPLTATVVTGPAHGTLTLNSNGSFTYTPTTDYAGADSFTYQASDGSTTSAVTTVSLTVNATNRAPVAVSDFYATTKNTPVTIDAASGVLANDTDADGNSLTAVVLTNPANGTLALNANGSFTYTPNSGFSGTDSFTYKANDGTSDSGSGTVTISVTDMPLAALTATSVNISGPASGLRGQELTFTLTAPGETATQVTYDLDWDNNGTVDETVTGSPTGATATHAFPQTGNVTASVKLRDSELTDTQTVALTASSQTGNLVTIGGTSGNDTITVTLGRRGQLVVRMNGAVVGQYPRSSTIVIHGGDGNDSISAGRGVFQRMVFHGGAGNDRLVGGYGADILDGGAGNDTLSGRLGDDLLIGGDGADSLNGGLGFNLMLGGSTDYDADDAALLELLATWRHGGSLARRLARVNGSDQPLSSAALQTEDGDIDRFVSRYAFDAIFASLDDVDSLAVKGRMARVFRV